CGSTDGQIDISDTVKITKTVSGLAVSNCFVKDGKFYIENNIKKELASATSDDKGDVKFNNIDTEDLIYNNNECKFAYYGDVSNASCSGSGCPKICSVNPESIQCITVPWNKVVSNFLDIDKIDKLEANNVSTVSKASDCFSGLTLAGVAAGCTATCSAANQPNCQVSAPANSEAGSGVCCGAGSCYKCKNNYSWSSSACAADTQTVNCTAKPANADWNTSATVLQTWSGSAWQPSNASAYSAVAGTCKFKCSAGYSWDASDSSCKVVVKQTACKEIKIADHANDVNGDRINIVFSMDTLSYTLFGNTISNKDQIMNVAQEFKKVQPYASYLDKFNFWVIDIDVGGVDWYNSKYGANKSTLASPGAQTETDFLWITDAQYSSYEDYLGGYQLLVSEFCPGFKKIQGIHISSQYGWGDLLIGDKTRFGVVFLGKQLVNTKNLFHELGHSIGLVDEAYDGGWDASQGDFWDLGNNVLKNSQGYYLGSNYKWGDLVIGEEEHTYYSSVQYKSGTFSSFRPSDTYFMGEASSGGFGANSTEGKYSDVVERLICRRLDSIVELDSGTYCKTKYDNDLGCNQYGANNSYNIDFNQPSEFMFSGKNNPYPEISKLELLNCK
ncbi:MAG: hypothetical protein ABIB72_03960, partial [Candidatus Falkowbacteria bacterium]